MAADVVAGRHEHVAANGANVEPRAESLVFIAGAVADLDAVWLGEVDVPTAAAGQDPRRVRESAVLLLEGGQRDVAAVTRVDVDDDVGVGPDRDVRLRVLAPPLANDRGLGGRVFESTMTNVTHLKAVSHRRPTSRSPDRRTTPR